MDFLLARFGRARADPSSFPPPHRSKSRPRAGTLPASFQNNGAPALSLPNRDLSSAFGPTVFSQGGWAPQTPPAGAGRAAHPADSVRSPGSSTGGYGEPDALRTLDYLGLDNDSSPVHGLAPFTDRDLNSSGSLLMPPTRLRSNTVATTPFKLGSRRFALILTL